MLLFSILFPKTCCSCPIKWILKPLSVLWATARKTLQGRKAGSPHLMCPGLGSPTCTEHESHNGYSLLVGQVSFALQKKKYECYKEKFMPYSKTKEAGTLDVKVRQVQSRRAKAQSI